MADSDPPNQPIRATASQSMTVTGSVGGIGAAIVSILNWIGGGSKFPIEADTAASLAYLIGMFGMAVHVLTVTWLKKKGWMDVSNN